MNDVYQELLQLFAPMQGMESKHGPWCSTAAPATKKLKNKSMYKDWIMANTVSTFNELYLVYERNPTKRFNNSK